MSQKLYRNLDETFEHFLETVTVETTDSELTPKLRTERRKKADKNDFEFCKIYFPNIFGDPFNELHTKIEAVKSGFFTFSGSRFFGKTAFTTITKIVKPICIGGTGLIGHAQRDKEDAAERTAAVVRMMERNKKLMYDYSINIQQDKKGYYIINNKTLVALGMREGLRNFLDEDFKRFQTIICDDLFNRQTVGSELDNEKVYNFVMSECTGQLENNGMLIWLFNYITENSPGKKVADERPDNHFNLPALNDKDETNWPGSIWSTEELDAKKKKLPYDVWMGDWMNEPLMLGEVFDEGWIKLVNLNFIKIVTSLSAVDPSFGKSPSACNKGIATLGLTNKNTSVLLDVYNRKEDYSRVFDYLFSLHSSMPNHTSILFENDFNQWFIAKPYYDNWKKLRKVVLPLITFSAKNLVTQYYGADKGSRIMNLVYPFQTGELTVNQTITGTLDYRQWKAQYMSFGKSKDKLDALDATASAFIMLLRFVTRGSFKGLHDRWKVNNSWIHNR